MKKVQYIKTIVIVLILSSRLLASGPAAGAEEEPGAWDQASRELREAAGEVKGAAGAVKEATRETSRDVWEKTRDESRQIYHRTREKSREGLEKTKETSGTTWDTIKQESKETWNKIRKESKEIIRDTKARIHQATAPETDSSVPDAHPAPADK